ncbi:sigma-70 family RNA polymerase sigma factor [Gryllotalpicola koreensis]|uniref:RNA polymerase sigma factor n=1 Tax=Gryllotalpicola koreensis TaxID=993086 RepID=A0ABP7ZPV4_9MICO
MTDSTSEGDEWADALAGDSHAFAAVYDLHRERVYRLALRLAENRHDAEDLVATAFLELWRRRHSVRVVGGSVLPWLLVTASNAAKNQARGIRRHRKLIEAIPRTADDGLSALEAVDDAVDHAAFAGELRRMPDQDRALLVMTALEGYSTAAAAEALGISAGAARVRLHRLRGRLRDAYRRTLPNVAAEEGGTQ